MNKQEPTAAWLPDVSPHDVIQAAMISATSNCGQMWRTSNCGHAAG